jgi:transcriptional regulator with XRE-family HTH domain
MNDFGKYLEEVRTKTGIKNDRQLAMRIGVSPAYINYIKHGRIPEDDVCIKLAELANDKPESILLMAHKLKATEKSKPYWEHMFKTLAAATLASIITLPFLTNLLDTRYIM